MPYPVGTRWTLPAWRNPRWWVGKDEVLHTDPDQKGCPVTKLSQVMCMHAGKGL